MKNLRLSILALFIIGLFVVSCSTEDETPVATDETATDNNATDNTDDTNPMDTTIVVNDTTFMIMENSDVSASVGTLAATTNHGSVTFSIKSQSIDGALAIDENSGEMTVADASVFDYETNTSLTAVVSVMNGTKTMDANVTVEIEDQNVFLSSLTDSKSAYESAKDGDWIEVTKAEYETLQAIMSVNEVGVSSESFPNNLATAEDWSGGGLYSNTISGDSSISISSGSYLYGFKYYSTSDDPQTGVKVKLSSTGFETGFNDFGNPLPTHSGKGVHFFIYKGDRVAVTAESFIGVMGWYLAYAYPRSSFSVPHSAGDTDDFTGFHHSDHLMYLQGLTTTKVQW